MGVSETGQSLIAIILLLAFFIYFLIQDKK
jgi:hypothetical protein